MHPTVPHMEVIRLTVRRESVELSLQDAGFTTGMARAAVVAAALNHELENLDGAGTRANRSTTALGSPNGGIAHTAQQARSASNDLNKYTGRLNLLATAATTLGPALIPIGATAVPAVAGLTAGLGAAVGAVGTAVLAFHGLGDALKALDAYQLEPTAANLQKMHDTLGNLSPAAQELVHRLDALEAPLKNLQTVAQNGMFPGLNEGLDSMMALLPDVEIIVQRIAKEMGSLTADAGASLANDADWQAFFTYVKQDAAPTLDAFARSTGNVIAGLGSLMVAFRPLSDDFSAGMLDMSRSFREWAANLSGTSGFQDFIGYIRENGPAVRDFFSALAQAMVGLVKAAAPWGATMLPILTDVAKVFGVIADSPLGPVLYDTAAAMLVLNRATAVLGSQSVTRLSTGLSGLRTSLRTMPADLRAMGSEYQNLNRAQSASLSLMSGTTGAANRVRNSLAGLGEAAKVAAGIGGFMVLSDGMQRTGKAAKVLETTAGAAAIGFGVGGPWGAAIGTATGLVLGFADGNDKAAEASSGLAGTLDQQTGALTKMSAAWVASQFNDSQLQAFSKYGVQIGEVTNAILQGGQALDDFKTKRLGAIFDEVDGDKQLYDAYKQIDSISGQVTATQRQYAAQTDATTAAQGKFGDSAAAAAEKALQLSAAMKKQRQDARTAAQQWTAFGNSLSDTKVSLDGWIADMAKQNRALAQFAHNAETAANRGLRDGLIKQLEAAGPAGALRMQQLADGTKTQIGKANAAFALGRRAIQQYVDMKVPPKQLNVDSSQALNSINTIQGRIDALHGKTVSISTNYTATYTNGPGLTPDIRHKANGGSVPKDGGAYADRYHYLLAPGEEVISNRNGQADRFRPLLKAINAGRLADGGTARPIFHGEGPRFYDAALAHNILFTRPPSDWDWPWQTGLTARQERRFEHWVSANHVPFDVGANRVDYDMRGYWLKTKGKGWHEGSHFPDTFKTPYDTTFSHESKYATKNNPFYWHGDKLVDQRNGQVIFAANGGYIAGAGGPRDDKIPAWLSNGEFVMNAAATARLRPLLEHENAKGYAKGGYVGGDAWVGYSRNEMKVVDSATKLTRGLDDLSFATKKQTQASVDSIKKAIDAQKQLVQMEQAHTQAIRDSITSLSQSTADRFRGDQLGSASQSANQDRYSSDPATAQAGWEAYWAAHPGRTVTSRAMDATDEVKASIAAMQKDTSDARTFDASLAKVRAELRQGGVKKGQIDQTLAYLSQSGSVSQAQALAGSSQLAMQFQQVYGQRQQVTAQLGQHVALAQYGDTLARSEKHQAAAVKELVELKSQLRTSNHRLAQLEDAVKKSAKDTGAEVGTRINKAVVTAGKGRTP